MTPRPALYLQGFAYVPESLQLGVDALGRPSGEAWLTFESSDEALRRWAAATACAAVGCSALRPGLARPAAGQRLATAGQHHGAGRLPLHCTRHALAWLPAQGAGLTCAAPPPPRPAA